MKNLSTPDKPRIAITLFEDQLVRNYLTGDNGKLFTVLASRYDVLIITNEVLYHDISLNVKRFGWTNVSIRIFESYLGTFTSRILSSALHWSLNSNTIKLKLARKKPTSRFARKLLNRISRNSSFVPQLFRLIFLYSLPKSRLMSKLRGDSDLPSVVFVTSLTNLLEDVMVAALFRKLGRKTIGTVRSWDNLTSHGHLRFEPDVFLCHSEFMESNALSLHKFDSRVIKKWNTPAYRMIYSNSFSNKVKNRSVSRALYACMGSNANPDEVPFINAFVTAMELKLQNFSFDILQHPKFPHSVDTFGHFTNIKQFNYLDTNLFDYYDFLRSYDVIICGGTSVALDSVFAQVPLILVNFEVCQQNTFFSALRYFDSLDHTKYFFERLHPCTASSMSQLLDILSSSTYGVVDRTLAINLLGFEQSDMTKILTREIDALAGI